MAEANPGKTFQPEKNEESEAFREHLESVRDKMQERSQRSKNKVTIFLYGLSGDGKSSTLNYLFDANIIPTGRGRSQTRNVTEYGCSLKGSPWFGVGLNIGFIDTPGFDDTCGEDSDAENLAKISHFLGKVDHVFPNIVLIVVSALGNRLGGVNSRFSKMLHVLTKLNIVDTRRPNVVIVVTHAMHFTKEEYVSESKNIVEICQLLARAHFSIEVPVVFIENLDKRNEMEQEGEWRILPDGTKQPLNLFDAMINLMKLSGDEVGVEAIRLFFSESGKYEVKEIRKNPDNLDVKNDCPEWEEYTKENFFSNEKNEIYLILSNTVGPDLLQTFPLVYHLQKINLVKTSHLRNKNLIEIKRTLHPFKLTQQEIEWLIRLFDVSPLMRTKLDFKSLGLGYSRQFNEKRKRILEIGPLEIVKWGGYEISVPKHCIAKDLKQITIEIVYDENATWCGMRCLKLIFRIRYVLFQVDVDHLENFNLNSKFVSSLERSLPKGVDPDNLVYKFENPKFANFVKEYALHCTTGLYFGGFIEGELYFDPRNDVDASRKYLAEESASLLTQLETYFSCIQNGTIPQQANFRRDAEISKKLAECNLTCKGGSDYFHFKKIIDITVHEWNNWIYSIDENTVCFDKTVNSSPLRDVLVSSKNEKISSYAREFNCIPTGKEIDLKNLRFEVSLNVTAGIGSDSEIAYQEKKEVLTRIEAADKFNILECCATFEFNEKLSQWTAQFDLETFASLNKIKDFISNASLDDITPVYNVSKTVVEKCCREAVQGLEVQIIDYQDREAQARNYFNSARFQKRDSLLQHIELHYKLRNDALKIESQFNQMRYVILQKAKEDIIRLNENDDRSKPYLQLKNLFEKHWSEWDAALTKNCESLPIDIDSDLQYAFNHNSCFDNLEISKESRELLIGDSEKLANFRQLDFQLGSNHYKIFIPSKHQFVSPQCTFTDFHDYSLNHAFKEQIATHDILQDRISKFIQIVSSLCQEFLLSLSKTDPYSIQSFFQLISIVCGQVEEFNDREKGDITQQIVLTNLFMSELSFYNCCRAATHLKMLQKDFLSDTNTSTQFLNLKKELKPIFIQLCQGTQTEFSCAKALAEVVFMKMVNFLESKLRTDIIPHFQNDISNLDTFKSRGSLQLAILKELASKREFDQYIAYINDPINFIRNWIESKFKMYCNNKEVHKEIKLITLDPTINKLKQIYIAELKYSIESSKSDWRTIFYEKVKLCTKGLRKCDFDILEVYQNPMNNAEEFAEFFASSFDNMYTPFGWFSWISTTITNAIYSNTRCLTKLLITCQSLCPFCKEPCLMSAQGHLHYCGSLHRPKGLVGYFHEATRTFSIRECTHSMNTDHVIIYNNQKYKYTDYAHISPQFASWKILGEDAANSNYWRWVFYTFRHQFIQHYGYTYNPDVDYWSDLTEDDVITQLDLLYEKFLH